MHCEIGAWRVVFSHKKGHIDRAKALTHFPLRIVPQGWNNLRAVLEPPELPKSAKAMQARNERGGMVVFSVVHYATYGRDRRAD